MEEIQRMTASKVWTFQWERKWFTGLYSNATCTTAYDIDLLMLRKCFRDDLHDA